MREAQLRGWLGHRARGNHSSLHPLGAGGSRDAAKSGFPTLEVPQSKPLSPGEVLGCTAPVLKEQKDAIVFVADGRFHLEAIMIANPTVPAFRHDPYQRILTREEYAHGEMRRVRRDMVNRARGAKSFGIVLGTLGRQGNPAILEHLEKRMKEKGLPYIVFLISEMNPHKMSLLKGADAFVQIACPRLSIDWGEDFTKPVLTPYEAEVCLGGAQPGGSRRARSRVRKTRRTRWTTTRRTADLGRARTSNRSRRGRGSRRRDKPPVAVAVES